VGPAGFVKEEEAQDRDDAFEGDVVPELDGPGGGFHNEAGECACCDSAEEDAAGIDDEAFAAVVEGKCFYYDVRVDCEKVRSGPSMTQDFFGAYL
jgi:hypothetical protein